MLSHEIFGGPLKYFLGIEVARNKQGIYLCQRKYSLDILSNTAFLGTKPLDFFVEQYYKLGKAKSPLLSYLDFYGHLVARLIYLSITRQDLSYSV